MGFYQHLERFYGKPVVVFPDEASRDLSRRVPPPPPSRRYVEPTPQMRRQTEPPPLPDPATHAFRVEAVYRYGEEVDSFRDVFTNFLAQPDVERVDALLIGTWITNYQEQNSADAAGCLTAAAEQLPNLRHLFFGELISQDNEVSWIEQSDLRELFEAYPLLQSFHVRGTQNLTLGPISHRHLTTLHVESGGLPTEILAQITDSELPELTDLDVCIGQPWHGWEGTPEDVVRFINAADERFPKLNRLGVRNMHDDLTDAIAKYLALHPLLDRLEELDLSLGTLGDEGARALLDGGKLTNLQRLNVAHNFLSEPVRAELEALPIEVAADSEGAYMLGDGTEDDPEERYSAVGE